MEYLSLLLAGLSLGCIVGWTLCQAYVNKKKQNNVHFYVARDSDNRLHLWLGKPIKINNLWWGFRSWQINGIFTEFRLLGAYQDFFSHLKWEDEPVEVFLNMED